MVPEETQLTLKSVWMQNFRAVNYATIPLHPRLTVLIGENATGKTTILEAIGVALLPFVRQLLSKTRSGLEIREEDFRSEPVGDLLGQPYRAEELKIELDTTIGEISSIYSLDETYADKARIRRTLGRSAGHWLEELLASDRVAPILVYYRDNRGQLHGDREPFFRRTQTSRNAAYNRAFDTRVYFDEAVAWFEEAESAELRDQRERGGEFLDRRISAVRGAVERLVPEVSNLRMQGRPPRLTMTLRHEGQEERLLDVGQLSSGFRTMVALAMDLARRMADLNPQLEDATQSPGIVLIDEIDLHLHPRWQQLVVKGLLDAFPNVQFVMTTHSPQVLTTLEPENILKLGWKDDRLTLEQLPSTEGAEAGRILTSVMGVSERPPADVSKFVLALEKYLGLLRSGKAETAAGSKLLQEMQSRSPDDPILATLDLERRRLAARRG